VSVACSYFVFLLSSLSDNSKSSDKYLPKIASALTTAYILSFFNQNPKINTNIVGDVEWVSYFWSVKNE